MIIEITKDDILRNQPLPPGWYEAVIRNISSGTAKTDGSPTLEFQFEILKDGRTMTQTFSMKAKGMLVPLIEAVTGTKLAPNDYSFDISKFIGQKLQVQVVHDTYQGRIVAKIGDYANINTDTSVPF